MNFNEERNPILVYWDWLDELPEITREAVLLEDKEGYGHPDPSFKGAGDHPYP